MGIADTKSILTSIWSFQRDQSAQLLAAQDKAMSQDCIPTIAGKPLNNTNN